MALTGNCIMAILRCSATINSINFPNKYLKKLLKETVASK